MYKFLGNLFSPPAARSVPPIYATPKPQKQLNIAFFGSMGAGQTSLLCSLTQGGLLPAPKPTMGLDMQVIKLAEQVICAWDVSYTERYSRSTFGRLSTFDFKAIFFTINPVSFKDAPLDQQHWINRFIEPKLPKILIINQCDRHWQFNIKRWVKFAFANKFNAIIETSVTDSANLQLIINEIISGENLTPDTLSIYRYNNTTTQSNPQLQRFALNSISFNHLNPDLLEAKPLYTRSLDPSSSPSASSQLSESHTMLRRTKSLNDLSQARPASLFGLQLS